MAFHSRAAFAFWALAVPLSRLPASVWPVERAWPFLHVFLLPATWSAQAA